MSNNVVIRPYREGDEKGIFSLFSPDKNGSDFRTQQWWNWRNIKNPAGKSITWVAEADGKIVSHLSSMPLKTKQFNKTVTIIRGGDGKTNPAFRKKGIFSKLMMNSIKEGGEKGWSFFLSLPSNMLYPTLIHLGWADVCKISKLVKVLKPEWFPQVVGEEASHLKKLAALVVSKIYPLVFANKREFQSKNNIKVIQQTDFGKNFDLLWDEVSHHVSIGIIRDSAYLNWRYRDNPRYEQPDADFSIFSALEDDRLVGFVVVGCYQTEYCIGRLLEFIVLPDKQKAGEALLAAAEKYLIKKNADIIQALSQNPFLPSSLSRKFEYVANPFTKVNFAIKPMAATASTAKLTNRSGWLISWGEHGVM